MQETQVRQPAARTAALLTATDLGRLLGIDTTTVYRMAADGRLPAVKVGRQWRFSADEVARVFPWVGRDRSATATTSSPVPVALAESLLEVSAYTHGVMMVLTDLTGTPLTEVANPCPWFLAHRADPRTLAACLAEWRTLADDLDLAPRFVTGPLGFDCARAFVRRDHRLVAMVLAGGVAPLPGPGVPLVPPTGLYTLDAAERAGALDTLTRLAAVLGRAVDVSDLT